MSLARRRRQAPLVHRYFEPSSGGRDVVKLAPGGVYISRADEDLVTVLGSCIAVCVHDPVAKVGGMNHFMLPGNEKFDEARAKTANHWDRLRFGCFAMESLINGALQAGAEKHRLELKVFGGATMLAASSSVVGRVGIMNIRFVRHYVDREGLNVVAEDTGGSEARRLKLHPQTGQAFLWREDPARQRAVIAQEQRYFDSLTARGPGGNLELF